MKIAHLNIYQYDLPVKNGPYTMSYGEIFSLDTTLVKLLNEFRERRASSENGAENSPEIADALLNALDTPDDARFDDELRAISERIAALS